jgi:hypothetical protein
MRHLLPIGLGLLTGSAIYFGYNYWTHHSTEQKALAAAPGDADFDKPAAEECGIARTVLTALHASGAEKAWRTGSDVGAITLSIHSKVVNPVDVPGYTDEEADNLRSKAAADWRWCSGMTGFVTGLGWSAMGGDLAVPEFAVGRPAMSKAGDEAKVYELYLTPDAATGALRLSRGPWLVTLHKGAAGAWQVTSTDEVKRGKG